MTVDYNSGEGGRSDASFERPGWLAAIQTCSDSRKSWAFRSIGQFSHLKCKANLQVDQTIIGTYSAAAATTAKPGEASGAGC
jgi:hypothetical protein